MESGKSAQVGRVIEFPGPEHHFLEVNLHFDLPGDILGVTADDPGPELVETFVQ